MRRIVADLARASLNPLGGDSPQEQPTAGRADRMTAAELAAFAAEVHAKCDAADPA